MIRIRWVLGVFVLGAVAWAGEERPVREGRPPATRPATAEPGRAELEQLMQAYVDTFNRHDAGAIAALWTTGGVYVDRSTGDRTEGREQIQADMADLFREQPGIRLDVELDRVRMIRPDVAIIDGRAFAESPDMEPNTTFFSATAVRSDGKWLIDTVQETEPPRPPDAHTALRQLEWLMGSWQDESEDAIVESTTRWSTSGSFLIRSYTVQNEGDEQIHHGTQVIGWDPREGRIRSWVFDGDGSFGEGAWVRDGSDWIVRYVFTLTDGRAGVATQIITPLSDDRLRVQMVGQEIEGEPIPSTEPVTVLRVPATQASR